MTNSAALVNLVHEVMMSVEVHGATAAERREAARRSREIRTALYMVDGESFGAFVRRAESTLALCDSLEATCHPAMAAITESIRANIEAMYLGIGSKRAERNGQFTRAILADATSMHVTMDGADDNRGFMEKLSKFAGGGGGGGGDQGAPPPQQYSRDGGR